ncbi:Lon-like ATP-dependent protease [Erwinia toletana]|uniref:endopeptidase La n=1 Tax=Winslowiella toletana TaxID=92490 RepID=A0ABS4PEY2_9GAMM|nr:Lon protease family protein [Winslowiella toletana]MBP2170651.1 Lon-like ATP-dependent protease [Winslowiella toletana]
MTNNRLEWRALQPDTDSLQPLFSQAFDDDTDSLAAVQPRLINALGLLQQSSVAFPLLLVKCAENPEYLPLLTSAAQSVSTQSETVFGGHYVISGQTVSWQPASSADELFATRGEICFADWIEPEQLFGCVRVHQHNIQLEPGLLHRINGGTLVLSLRSLLAQPLMWLRLKQVITRQRFDWLSPDETRPLPVSIPSMPMQFRLVLSGERDALADFQEMEPELASLCIYSEFEENLQIADQDDVSLWCQWTTQLAKSQMLPAIEADFWPVLMRESVRHTGDQEALPLCPAWLGRQLREAALYSEQPLISGESLTAALEAREWREGYLAERVRDEILLDQILIETEGEAIGQINALSVIEFPGHPRAFGEPSRISCVVQPGDGEFTDVERKAELGGNIHAKGMMIMQAYLIAELQLDQQLPFSASLVFEQSYSEVDGDSASLAELCALVSALASQPINQQIAVTGSVDQFGNVQPVGGLNEKVEGFFEICRQRNLSGKQGVIIPASNVRHLCLQQDVVDAVRDGQFHIWAVSSADEALPLLTGVEWDKENAPCLLRSIQERIAQIHLQDARQRPWPLRWLNWFNHS